MRIITLKLIFSLFFFFYSDKTKLKIKSSNSARINNIEIDESWDVADADDFHFRSREQTKEDDVFIPKRKSDTIGIRDIGAWDIDVGSVDMKYFRPQPATKQHLREKTAFFHKDFKK